MVVEELQILIGCDASTAEKVLTELENRLSKFVKQAGAAFSDTKAIRAQGIAEREALKTDAMRAKLANEVAKSNLSLTVAQQRAAASTEKLNNQVKKTIKYVGEQEARIEQAAANEVAALRQVAETEEEVEARLDKYRGGSGPSVDAYKGRDVTSEPGLKETPKIDSDAAEVFIKNTNAAELYQLQVDLLRDKLQRLLGEENALAGGDGMNKALERVRGQIITVRKQLLKLEGDAKKTEENIGRGGGGFSRIVAKAKEAAQKSANAFAKMGTSIKKAFDKLPNIAKGAVTKTQGHLSKLGKSVKSIITSMVIWRGINALLQSVSQAFQNIAQASTKANSTMSDLQSGFTHVKNSIASALLPALQALTPVIMRASAAMASLFNMIGAITAKLRGESTFTKAVYVQQDYAASLNKSNKAAKDLQGTLAGFDQINLIQQQDSGGGDAAADVSGMFEETNIEDVLPTNISKWTDRLKAAIAAGDWYGVGQALAQGMSKGITTLDSWITNVMYPKGMAMMQALTSGMNGFIASFDWGMLGQAIATGMNTITDMLHTFWTQTDWAGLGQGLGTTINSWVENLDVAKVAETLSAALKGIADLIINAIETVNWQEIGTKVAEFIGAIDYAGITEKLFEGLGAALGGLAAFLAGLIAPAWESVKQWWAEKMEQSGGDVIIGLMLGITEALYNIGEWIYTHIFKPFIDGFKKAFGIQSPSKEMATQGEYIIQGMLDGITGVLSGIKSWVVSHIFNPVMDAIKNAFGIVGDAANKLKEIGSAIIDGIKAGITNAWTTFSTWVTEKFNSVITTAKAVFGIQSPSKVFRGIGSNIMAGMVQGIQHGKAAAVRSMEGVSKSLQGAFSVNTAIGVPTLADGGIAFGDTLARIGEYANARTNPEVIAPLDKLQSMLGNQQDTQTIISLLRRIAEQENEIALYPSAKLGRIASQSIKMYNATVGAV